MAVVLTRSTAELQRLTDSQWVNVFGVNGIFAVLANTTGASPQPTAASSYATWQAYFLPDNDGFYLYGSATPVASVYNGGNGRAEVPAMVFNDFEFDLYAPPGNSTATHVVITDLTSRILAVIEESPAITVNSSSTLSYTLNAWGEYA